MKRSLSHYLVLVGGEQESVHTRCPTDPLHCNTAQHNARGARRYVCFIIATIDKKKMNDNINISIVKFLYTSENMLVYI